MGVPLVRKHIRLARSWPVSRLSQRSLRQPRRLGRTKHLTFAANLRHPSSSSPSSFEISNPGWIRPANSAGKPKPTPKRQDANRTCNSVFGCIWLSASNSPTPRSTRCTAVLRRYFSSGKTTGVVPSLVASVSPSFLERRTDGAFKHLYIETRSQNNTW